MLIQILELLKSYKKINGKDYGGNYHYDWDVRLGVSGKDLSIQCGCACAICCDGYNPGESEDDEDEDENEDDEDVEYKKRRKIPCQCSDELLETRFHSFLSKFVLTNTLEDAELKASLVHGITAFESSLSVVDYHPGSNNQVIDVVHPSLYCYVKGVTQTVGNIDAHAVPQIDAVFQWLPSEFKVQRDNNNSVTSVVIDSYINNLPRLTNEGLYSTIGQVFGKLVPQFDKVLQNLHESARLTAPNATPATLANCQVIVKLANISIAPGTDASFPGGHWHLEGEL